MAVSRRRKKKQNAGPDVRGHLLRRLERYRERLIERDGVLHPEFVMIYRLDRIDALKNGQDVLVTGHEVRSLVPEADPLAVYRLNANNQLVKKVI